MSTAADDRQNRAALVPASWVLAIICNPAVKRSAEHVAWLLSSDVRFTTEGCTADNGNIAGRLDLAPNSVKNALLALRTHGFIQWSLSRTDGARIRTIRPVFVHDATTPVSAPPYRGDASIPAAGATLSPVKNTLRRRLRRSGSDGVSQPMLEWLTDQAPIPASTGTIVLDIASLVPNRTQSGCDADPILRAHDLDEHASDTPLGGELLGVFREPPLSNSTQTGCEVEGVRQLPARHESKGERKRRRYDPDIPLWMQTTAVQKERASFHAERLPWDARCGHDRCGSRDIAVVCADAGDAFCAQHRREANIPIAIATLDPDRG